MSQWDHTATIAARLDAVRATVHNANSKTKSKPLTFQQCHPFRRREQSANSIKITVNNFDKLRLIAAAMVR